MSMPKSAAMPISLAVCHCLPQAVFDVTGCSFTACGKQWHTVAVDLGSSRDSKGDFATAKVGDGGAASMGSQFRQSANLPPAGT